MKAGWKKNYRKGAADIEHYFNAGDLKSLCKRGTREGDEEVREKCNQGYACSRCYERRQLQEVAK